MKMVKKMLYIIFTIGIFILVPFVVFTLITSKTDKFLGIQSFVVLSGSMQPTIPVGSIIYTQKQSWYPQGSIISFKKADATVTHRVVKVTNRANTLYYQTKGDANKTPDPNTISQGNILGEVIFTLPYLGYITSYTQSLQGLIFFIIIPATVLVYHELLSLKREILAKLSKFNFPSFTTHFAEASHFSRLSRDSRGKQYIN